MEMISIICRHTAISNIQEGDTVSEIRMVEYEMELRFTVAAWPRPLDIRNRILRNSTTLKHKMKGDLFSDPSQE